MRLWCGTYRAKWQSWESWYFSTRRSSSRWEQTSTSLTLWKSYSRGCRMLTVYYRGWLLLVRKTLFGDTITNIINYMAGVILCFRELIQDALSSQLEERIPFLTSSIKVNTDEQHSNINVTCFLFSGLPLSRWLSARIIPGCRACLCFWLQQQGKSTFVIVSRETTPFWSSM